MSFGGPGEQGGDCHQNVSFGGPGEQGGDCHQNVSFGGSGEQGGDCHQNMSFGGPGEQGCAAIKICPLVDQVCKVVLPSTCALWWTS